jgi:integrase
MHLRKRGKIWYGTVYVGGVAKERSTACTDKAAARTVLSGWEREAADPDRAATKATLNDALALMLDDRAARVHEGTGSADTVEFYRRKAGHLLRLMGHDFPVAKLKDGTHAWRYIDARRQEGARPTTINKELITLRCALKLARERGHWRGDIDAVIPTTFEREYVPRDRSPSRADVLALLPHLYPDAAAALCFVVATSAESAALHDAMRSDVPAALDSSDLRVRIRGTKNSHRARLVPIVSDEQRLLLDYAMRHSEGREGKLFGPLSNFRREISDACKKAGVAQLSPHDLRRAAGQWLVDLGVPLELVSRMMGHASTRITEQVYAKVKDQDIADRVIDAIDPRYAQRAHQARGARPLVATLADLPAPKQRLVRDTIDGDERTLAQWAKSRRIPKASLHHRVVVLGMSIEAALAMGKGAAPTATSTGAEPAPSTTKTAYTDADVAPASSPAASANDCRTGAGDASENADASDASDIAPRTTPRKKRREKRPSPTKSAPPSDPTPGFSIPVHARLSGISRRRRGRVGRARSRTERAHR